MTLPYAIFMFFNELVAEILHDLVAKIPYDLAPRDGAETSVSFMVTMFGKERC